MTSSEVAVRSDTMPAKLQYAKALADSGLLPSNYRRQPANVLYAIEYGDMLKLSPMAAITGIHVIDGKPTASAGLISALVRRAGHKLRVHSNGASATCEIIRADDPDYTFTVTWTLQRNKDGHPSAADAGLLNKDVWKKYPASMLKARAITQCARDACEEALMGMHYTPEELGATVDEDGVPLQATSERTDAPPAEPAREQIDWDAKITEAGTDVDALRDLYKLAGGIDPTNKALADRISAAAKVAAETSHADEVGTEVAEQETIDAEVVDEEAADETLMGIAA